MARLRDQLKLALRNHAAAAALVGGPAWGRLAPKLPEAVRSQIEQTAARAPTQGASAKPRAASAGPAVGRARGRFFTDEEAQDLNATPLSEVMRALGAERLERSGTWQMWRLGGAKIGTNDRSRTWHDFSAGQGSGGAIRLVQYTEGLGFYEAVQWLNESFGTSAPAAPAPAPTDPETRAALRPLIAQVRDIPLADVVRAHGHDGGLRIEGEAFWDRANKKRYGAIDLARELRGGFAQGVAFLVQNFRPELVEQLPAQLRRGPERGAPGDEETHSDDERPAPSPRHISPPPAAAASAPTAAADEARPLEMPPPSSFHWPGVRKYLTQDRGLSADLVDFLHSRGEIYADAAGRAVFVMAGAAGHDDIAGAEIRGLGPGATRFMAPGTQKSAGSFMFWAGDRENEWPPRERKETILLVESAIDALSVCTLAEKYNTPDLPHGGVLVVSTGGIRATLPEWINDHLAEGGDILVGYDNDEAGDRAAEALIASLGDQGRRLRPKFGKDFNDELVARRAMAAEAEKEAARVAGQAEGEVAQELAEVAQDQGEVTQALADPVVEAFLARLDMREAALADQAAAEG